MEHFDPPTYEGVALQAASDIHDRLLHSSGFPNYNRTQEHFALLFLELLTLLREEGIQEQDPIGALRESWGDVQTEIGDKVRHPLWYQSSHRTVKTTMIKEVHTAFHQGKFLAAFPTTQELKTYLKTTHADLDPYDVHISVQYLQPHKPVSCMRDM